MGPLLIGIRSCLQRESLITRICTSPKSRVLSDIQCTADPFYFYELIPLVRSAIVSTKIDPTKIDPTPRLGTCRPYRGPTRYSDFYWLNKSSVNLQTRAGDSGDQPARRTKTAATPPCAKRRRRFGNLLFWYYASFPRHEGDRMSEKFVCRTFPHFPCRRRYIQTFQLI